MNNDIQPIPIRRVDGVQPRPTYVPPVAPPPPPPIPTPPVSVPTYIPEPVVESVPVYTPIPESVVSSKHEEPRQKVPKQDMSPKKIKIIVGILIALVIALAGGGIYFYMQSKKVEDPQKVVDANKAELASLITAVGKLILLPTDEQPQLATVSDPEKLKDQKFFANALLNDKVLIYTKASRAILYRPSTNMIIEVAPINLGGANASTATPVPLENTPATSGTAPKKP